MAENNQDKAENVRQQADLNPQVVNPLIALRDYAIPPTVIQPVIRRPAIQANN